MKLAALPSSQYDGRVPASVLVSVLVVHANDLSIVAALAAAAACGLPETVLRCYVCY